jgi:hypothetical protein
VFCIGEGTGGQLLVNSKLIGTVGPVNMTPTSTLASSAFPPAGKAPITLVKAF